MYGGGEDAQIPGPRKTARPARPDEWPTRMLGSSQHGIYDGRLFFFPITHVLYLPRRARVVVVVVVISTADEIDFEIRLCVRIRAFAVSGDEQYSTLNSVHYTCMRVTWYGLFLEFH